VRLAEWLAGAEATAPAPAPAPAATPTAGTDREALKHLYNRALKACGSRGAAQEFMFTTTGKESSADYTDEDVAKLADALRAKGA
jgi:hypothetical protein